MVATASSARLVFDVGFHKGEDSEFYLKKGFRVVAVEANPALHAAGRERFAASIHSGQLTLVHAAVAGSDGPVPFFLNARVSEWGTISKDWAERNAELGAASEQVAVPGMRFERLLEEFGVPYYLKIDIEGADLLCLEALRAFASRPAHLSIESNKTSWRDLVKEFRLLCELGYRRFKVVSQEGVSSQVCPAPAREGGYVQHRFVRGSTGAFGEEAPGAWLSERQALGRYRRIFLNYRLFGDDGWFTERSLRLPLVWRLIKHLPRCDWYDTHAAL